MDTLQNDRQKRRYGVCFFILWAAQMAAAFYFCTQKQGFHEDELYTYYSTARTNGFYVENGKWMDRETYRNEFVVLPDERFQYGLVKQVQSWDVHPPMYYWVFHTVASFVPGVFSKWIGLSVNLFFHGINLLLLVRLTYLVSGKDERLALLVNLVYGFTPAAMSGVVFIRMYEMLTTFVLLCAILHVRVVRAAECGNNSGMARGRTHVLSAATLLAMAAVTYAGFLTQYYYFIFLFFLAAAFCLWLLRRDKNVRNCLRYAVAQGLAFGLAYLTYPAFPGQMFRGQRGAQATKNFFDISNTFERLRFFFDLMNGYVFGYLLLVILLTVAVLAVGTHRQSGGKSAFWMLLFTAAGYFLAVSKTALLLGNTSNRYQLPVYGIVVLLAFYACKTLWGQAVFLFDAKRVPGEEPGRPERRYRQCLSFFKTFLPGLEWIGGLFRRFVGFLVRHRKMTEKAAVLFCLALLVSGYLCVDVVFLYPGAEEERARAREQAAEGIPVVYVYQPGEEWCIWAVADVLMEYERVYFIAADSEAPITEPAIVNAGELVAYLPQDDWENGEGQLARIAASCHALEAHLQYSHPYCESCYFYMTEAWKP